MIDKKIYDLDYIRELQARYKTDPGLLERVLYAFGLLEALVKVGMKFTFKGGTSLMLLLDHPIRLVTFAVSLGHDESLIFPQPSYDERIHLYPEKFRKGFIRFSVGLEDADDIIADLDQALRSIDL